MKQKKVPFLCFDWNVGEAMEFYISVFKNAEVTSTMPGPEGKLMVGASGECLGDPDPKKAQRAMQAMLKMKKIDIAVLQKACDSA